MGHDVVLQDRRRLLQVVDSEGAVGIFWCDECCCCPRRQWDAPYQWGVSLREYHAPEAGTASIGGSYDPGLVRYDFPQPCGPVTEVPDE